MSARTPVPGLRGPRLVALPSPALERADDASLALAAVNGDPRAGAVLWDRFSPLVRRMLERTLGPGHDVEDLLHRVFLRLLRRAGALRGLQEMRAVFLGATTNVLVTELRQRSAVRLFLGLRLSRALTREQRAPACPEGLVALYDILDGLTPRTRVAFAMRYFENLQVAEIAAALGISEANVSRRLTKAARHVLALARPEWWLDRPPAEAEPAGNVP